MKPFEGQTHFEILDVPIDASQAELDAAYERAKKYLGPDSVAVYSLAEPSETEALVARVEAAYRVLSDPDLRARYCATLGEPGAPPIAAAPRSAPLQQTLDQILAEADSAPWRIPRPSESAPVTPPVAPASQAGIPETANGTSADAAVVAADSPPAPEAQRPAEPAPLPAVPPQDKPASRRRAAETTSGPAPHPTEAPALASEMALDEAPRRGVPVSRSSDQARPLDIGPEAQFSGELLRRVREAKGLSLRELAERTRIAVVHIESLEADQYESLQPRVYLRGQLMSIARELRLDPVRVSRSYLELVDKARGHS